MEQKIGQSLKGIPETLLIPLWARAVEAKQPRPIITDEKSIEMMERIDYNFSKFEGAWMSQIGVVIRTQLLDNATEAFIRKYPDAIIINIGCGLDTRFFRVDNGKIRWFDLDLPEAIGVRQQFFCETDRYKMMAKSVFDYSWIDEVGRSDRPVLIIAEGVFMYFTEQEVKDLMNMLTASFKGAEMLVEIITPSMTKRSKQHDSLGKMDAKFQWGVKSGKEIEKYNDKIEFIEEWNYYDYHPERWRWVRLLAMIPAFKNRFSGRIVHLVFCIFGIPNHS
jgi:O-methyltransferase involved in polyketide biosynthesis